MHSFLGVAGRDVFGKLRSHVGADVARGHDVGGDATAAELAGDGAGHALEPGLGGRVVDLPRTARVADDRGDEHDAPGLCRLYVLS